MRRVDVGVRIGVESTELRVRWGYGIERRDRRVRNSPASAVGHKGYWRLQSGVGLEVEGEEPVVCSGRIETLIDRLTAIEEGAVGRHECRSGHWAQRGGSNTGRRERKSRARRKGQRDRYLAGADRS